MEGDLIVELAPSAPTKCLFCPFSRHPLLVRVRVEVCKRPSAGRRVPFSPDPEFGEINGKIRKTQALSVIIC